MYITHSMLEELSQKIKQIEEYLKCAPQGYLKVNTRDKQYVYYHMLKEKKDKETQRYLRTSDPADEKLKQSLIQKQYYQRLLPELTKEADSLKLFFDTYHPENKYDVYEQIAESRKRLLVPEYLRSENIVKEWEEQEWQPNTKYTDNLRYETNRGELVRSKSEIIIADMLYYYKDLCAYRYEAPLYLDGRGILFHPDFTIMKRSTAEIFYWEHFGMMDNDEYANTCIKKINEYIMAGIYPGKQLICTFESSTQTIETKVIRELIKEYFG